MATVRFSEVSPSDNNDYMFIDASGKKYHIFTDSRGAGVKNISPDFWDKFYFCKKVNVDSVVRDGKNIVTKINSYK